MLALMGIASIAVLTWKRPQLRYPSAPRRLGHEGVLALITREATAVGLDPRVAVAFAERESGLNPQAMGDAGWAMKNQGDNYQRCVLANPRLDTNPWRNVPNLWRSYGLFQLLAPFHVQAHEHPHVLLDPQLNAQRGVRAVRSVLEKSGGNLYEARRRYVGCGPDTACHAEELARIDAAWAQSLKRLGLA
jgi:Transglycosylase SLT domain